MKGDVRLRIQVDDFDEFSLNNVRVEVDNPSRDNYDPIMLNKYLFMTKLASCQKPRLFGKFFFVISKITLASLVQIFIITSCKLFIIFFIQVDVMQGNSQKCHWIQEVFTGSEFPTWKIPNSFMFNP